MRTFTPTLRALAFAVFLAAIARAGDQSAATRPRFLGYLSSAGEWQFAIATEPGARPVWLHLGQTENGLIPRTYHPAAETLAIEIDGRLLYLKLEAGDGTKKLSSPPNLNRQQALQIARREVFSRDGWRSPRLFATTTANGNFQILIMQSTPLRTERRTLVLRPDGQIAFYLTLRHLAQGVPDLLFANSRGGKPYSFIPSKP